MRDPLKGFTLVELLIAISLLALVAGTVVVTLATGLGVWERARGQEAQYHRQLAMEQLRQDLRSAGHFEPIGFEGTYDEIFFPVLVYSQTEAGDVYPELGRVGYFLNRRDKTLCRSEYPYRSLGRVRGRDVYRIVLAGVDRIQFRYYVPSADKTSYVWRSRWSSPELPLAVKLEFRIPDPASGRFMEESLIVHLPSAYSPESEDSEEQV